MESELQSDSIPKKKNNLIGILVFVIILLLVASGYLYYQNTQLQSQIATLKITPTLAPEPTVEVDPTANWKTYQGQSVSLSYPPTWRISEEEIEGENTIIIEKGDDNNGYSTVIYIGSPFIFSTSGAIDANEGYIKNIGKIYFTNQYINDSADIIELHRYVDVNKPGDQPYYRFKSEANDNYTITVEFLDLEDKNLISQILSTFRFTN